MDQDFGPAQPIADVVKGAYKKMNDLFGVLPSPPKQLDPTEQKPTDTSWHDEMVKKAQQTYADQQKIPTSTKAQKRPAISAKVQVKTSVKPGPTKQVGGK